MNLSLKNKTAVVCGSSQGIGLASAIELASLGARIILLARDETRLQTAKSQIPKSDNTEHQIMVADFSRTDLLKKCTEEIIEKFGPVHILVNNTGGPPAGPVLNSSIEAFKIAFEQHLIANHVLMQAFTDGMKKESYGRIINVISTSVKQPLKGLGVSNTIRAAVANWSKTLANELAPFGITVNNVLPGATLTGRLSNIIQNKSNTTNLPESEIKQEMLDEIPCKRFGLPEEIASAVAFLASPAAAYINGINLPVDGGRTACL